MLIPTKTRGIYAPSGAEKQSGHNAFMTTASVPYVVHQRQTGACRAIHPSLPAIGSKSSNPKIPAAEARLQSEEHGDFLVIDLPRGYSYDMIFQQYYESQQNRARNKTAGMPVPSAAGEQSGSDALKTSVAPGFHMRQTGVHRARHVTSLPALHSASSNPKESQKKLSRNKTAVIPSPSAAEKRSGREAVKTTSVPSVFHMKETCASRTPDVTSLPALHSASSNSKIPPADTGRQPEDFSDLVVVGKRIDIPEGYSFGLALARYYASRSLELKLPTAEKPNQDYKICIDESENPCDSNVEHPFTNETTPESEASSRLSMFESDTLPFYSTSDTSFSSPDDNQELKFIQRSNCEPFGRRGSFKAWFDSGSSSPGSSDSTRSSSSCYPQSSQSNSSQSLSPISEASPEAELESSHEQESCPQKESSEFDRSSLPSESARQSSSRNRFSYTLTFRPRQTPIHEVSEQRSESSAEYGTNEASGGPFIFKGSVDESEVLPNYHMTETSSSIPCGDGDTAGYESDDSGGSVQAIHGSSSDSSLSSRSSAEVNFQYSAHPSSSPPGVCNADEVSEQQDESDYGGEVFYVSCSEESSASQQFRDVEFIPAEVDSPLEYEIRDPCCLGSQGSGVFEVTEVDDQYTLGNEYERLLRSQQLDDFEVTEDLEVTELDEEYTLGNEYESTDPCSLRSQGSGVFEVTEVDDKYTLGNEIPHGDLSQGLKDDVGAETPVTYVAADGDVPECKISDGDLSEGLKSYVSAETPVTYVAADGNVPQCKAPTEQESVFQKDQAIQCRYPFPETITYASLKPKPVDLKLPKIRNTQTLRHEYRLAEMLTYTYFKPGPEGTKVRIRTDQAIQCGYPFSETATYIPDGDKPQHQLMLEYLRFRCRLTEEQKAKLAAIQQATENERRVKDFAESHQPPQRSRTEYSWDFPQVPKSCTELPKLEPYRWKKLIKGTKGRIIGYTHPIPEHAELRKAIKEYLEDNDHPYRHAYTPCVPPGKPPYPHRTPYHEGKNFEEYERQLARKEAREVRREAKDAEMYASMRRMYNEIRNDRKSYPKGSKQIDAVIEKAVKARYAPTVKLPPLPKPQAHERKGNTQQVRVTSSRLAKLKAPPRKKK